MLPHTFHTRGKCRTTYIEIRQLVLNGGTAFLCITIWILKKELQHIVVTPFLALIVVIILMSARHYLAH